MTQDYRRSSRWLRSDTRSRVTRHSLHEHAAFQHEPQRGLDHSTTRTTCALLHTDDITETTHQRIFIPTRLGGLGMWSATITARAAFTASWIATLGKLLQWTQQTTHQLREQLPGQGSVLVKTRQDNDSAPRARLGAGKYS